MFFAKTNSPWGGTFTLIFPDGDVVTVKVDSDLKAGFPVKTFHVGGSYYAGSAIHTLVGNMDDDPNLEIVVTTLASGPLYAWKSDGSPVQGWPLDDIFGAAYPGMGELSADSPGLEVFSGYFFAKLAAYSGSGAHLPGWPRNSANFTATPPSLADMDGDGLDEIFIEEQDYQLHGYKADGTVLPGWPVYVPLCSQERQTPAIADLDGDGDLEVVTAGGACLFAFRRDGTLVAGFPVVPLDGFANTFPAIGDVDGDGAPEIVVVGRPSPYPAGPAVLIFSTNGTLKRAIPVEGDIFYGTAPALADLDGDGFPEIIVQTNSALNIVRGDGSVFPGWPVTWGNQYWSINSSPVVGDVDGDGLPDIVVTLQIGGNCCVGEVRLYDRTGTLHPRFPKTLNIGSGAVPAISDIDLDGRNEIIVTGSFWNGSPGDYDKVWVFDLGGPPHGAVQWGQFMGGPKHQGFYQGGFTLPNKTILNVAKIGAGVGTVDGPGISCGIDCTETYSPSTIVTLSANPAPGSQFAGWSGGGCSGIGTCVAQMDADTRVAATFDNRARLTANKSGTGSGNVTSSPVGISCGTDCTEDYAPGTAVVLTAAAAAGSTFVRWEGDCSGTGTCTLTMTSAKNVTVTFTAPLALDSSAVPKGEVGIAYNTSLAIGGGFPPYTVEVTKGSLPPGLNLGSPTIVGTPTISGKKSFTIRVTDQLGSSASKQFTLQIYPRLKVATLALAAGRVGRVYNKILKAKGGPAPYSWSILSGSLPPGLNLNPSTGEITGMPTSAGPFNVTFQVTDPLGGQAQKGFNLKIK